MNDDRPNPDDLLARVQADEVKQKRGKLKIFFGMAPGVGKTYAMLEAARKAATERVDVMVGYVEPHARPETHALVLGLDLLPRRLVTYGGKTSEEFDLEGALARKPQLILVDELAHSNAEGSTHPKRWQDVEDLLNAGIDVYTTLNVQHLNSLNDVVAQVTSIPVRETVPDHVFEQADEVELVDLSPDDLIERLRDGKVYVSAQASRALENFFRKGNLFALRELALRKTAERVSEQAIDYRQQHDVSRIWATSERLLVCVGPSPMSAKLVRATRRMAASLRARWVALHVELERSVLSAVDQQRLENNLRLAEELGATVETAYGNEFAETVLKYAHHHNITKIVVGKSQMTRWQELFKGAFVNELIRHSGDIDIYVISGDAEKSDDSAPLVERRSIQGLPFFWAGCSVAASTLLSLGLSQLFAPTNLAMIYLACVVFVSLIWGRGPSILATVLGVVAFDFFFIPPYQTFAVADSQYLLTFIVMLVTGLVISALASRIHLQTEAIRRRERRTAALFSLSKELARLPTQESVAMATRRIIQQALDVHVWVIVKHPDGTYAPIDLSPDDVPPQKHQGVIRWVFDHRRPAGFGTDTLPGADGTYLPLLGSDDLVGVLGVQSLVPESKLTISQMKLLDAFAGQVAMAIERCGFAVEAEHVRLLMETERLRNTLLSAVSHDLRTPLTGITGAASLLVEGNENLDTDARRDLAESILDESDRLNRLVANLLDMTRLEAGAISLQLALQPIEEVIGVVLVRLERQLRGHQIQTHLPSDLPPALIDGLLIQQVLTNLLDNATKFADPGSPIDLRAFQKEDDLVIEIADRGPGIPAGEQEHIFTKFYRVDGQSRTGTGIGLAICRGIIELHHGTIVAENRSGGGAIFRLTLPLKRTEVEATN